MRRLVWLTTMVLGFTGALTGPLSASAGADPADCGGKTPTIVPTPGSGVLTGTAGPDVISTEGGIGFTIHGLGGDDVICASAATIDAGTGNNTVINVGRSSFVYDSLKAAGFPGGITVDIPVGTVQHPGPTGVETDHLSGLEPEGTPNGPTTPSFSGTDFADRFIGSPYNDYFFSNAGNDYVDTGLGDDWVTLEAGTVYAGGGNDHVHLYDQGRVDAGSGNDRISLFAPTTADDDLGSPGAFTVDAGSGDDMSWVARPGIPKARFLPVSVRFTGGTGVDTLDLGGLGTPHGLLHADLGARTAHGGGGRAAWSAGTNRFIGTKYRDYFTGSQRADNIDGRQGNDVIRGRAGNDTLRGYTGRDYVDGGKGRDACSAERKVRCERKIVRNL